MRYFGLILIIGVLAWDIDALRVGCPLYIVAVFFAGHLFDYLTVGRIINRVSYLN